MNREEAKFVLGAWPIAGADGDDHQLAEALRWAQQDHELGEWFERERALDAVIARKLQTLRPSPNLRWELLAAQKVIPISRWRRRVALFAAAAAVVILAFTLAASRSIAPPALAIEDFAGYVARAASTLDHLDLHTRNLPEIRAWLRKGQAPSEFALPSAFAETTRVGCRVFDWQGKRVSLICFALGPDQVAHMFVVERSGLRNAPARQRVRVADGPGGIATAVWTDDLNAYVVALRGRAEELQHAFM